MATRNYEGKKFELNDVSYIVDSIAIEEALQININNKPFTVTMRTPGEDSNLIRGLLHSEGIIKDANYHPELILKVQNRNKIVTVIDMSIPEEELGTGYTSSRNLLSVSSCGICGRTELGEIPFREKMLDEQRMDFASLQLSFQKMNDLQHAFHQSGGTHAAAAYTNKGEMLCLMEDIGRHNAVDKVIGKLIMAKKLNQASCIIVSGRVSYEIVIKCFNARIPFLAAVSAPTSLAVDYAKELGITLLAFCRDKRATCYANPYRTELTRQQINAT
jgi:FdhD protein